jgi:hypothetical protein
MQERGIEFISSTEPGTVLGIKGTRPGELGKQLKELPSVAPKATNQGRGYELTALKRAAPCDE